MLLAATAFWSQSSGVQILVDTGPAVLIKIKSPCNIKLSSFNYHRDRYFVEKSFWQKVIVRKLYLEFIHYNVFNAYLQKINMKLTDKN